MKNPCILCSIANGRRVCKINDNALICPVCCAKTRNEACQGCVHYVQAEKHTKSKEKIFMFEVNPEVEEKVDQALAMAEQGNIAVAERKMLTLLRECPHLYPVHYGMGVIMLMKNQFDAALPFLNKAVEINPLFSEAWFNKAIVHQKKLELKNMFEALKKVTEVGEYDAAPVIQARKILRDFENRITKKNNVTLDEYLNAIAIFDEAFAAMERKEWEKAIRGFLKVIEIVPTHPQSYGNLGICHGILGKRTQALAMLDKALELDPEYEPAIINRAIFSELKEGEPLPTYNQISVDFSKAKAAYERAQAEALTRKG